MCERTVACRHPSTWAVTSSGTSSKNRSTIAARCLNGRVASASRRLSVAATSRSRWGSTQLGRVAREVVALHLEPTSAHACHVHHGDAEVGAERLGTAQVREPARHLHERVLDQVLRHRAVAGEQVGQAQGVGRVRFVQGAQPVRAHAARPRGHRSPRSYTRTDAPSGLRVALTHGKRCARRTTRRTSAGLIRVAPASSSQAKISGRMPSAVTPTTSPGSSLAHHRAQRGRAHPGRRRRRARPLPPRRPLEALDDVLARAPAQVVLELGDRQVVRTHRGPERERRAGSRSCGRPPCRSRARRGRLAAAEPVQGLHHARSCRPRCGRSRSSRSVRRVENRLARPGLCSGSWTNVFRPLTTARCGRPIASAAAAAAMAFCALIRETPARVIGHVEHRHQRVGPMVGRTRSCGRPGSTSRGRPRAGPHATPDDRGGSRRATAARSRCVASPARGDRRRSARPSPSGRVMRVMTPFTSAS